MILMLVDTGEMKIVPCRWSKSGWKYIEKDPEEQKFFANPNR